MNVTRLIGLGTRLYPMIMLAVQAVESLITPVEGETKEQRSARKRQAALDLTKNFVEVTEVSAGKDIFNDGVVVAMVGNAIDAYVGFQNAVNKATVTTV